MDKLNKPPLTGIFLTLGLLVCVWAYYPGLSGTFMFDDVPNISANSYLEIEQFTFDELWQATWSGFSGPLKRPVAMLSFGINHIFTAMDPWWMKLGNLLIHLVNGLLLLFVCRELIKGLAMENRPGMRVTPYIISGIWLLHPVNVTAVSYIVQRMTSLSASFVLLALYGYLKLRNCELQSRNAMLVGLLILASWGLGVFTKETALVLSVYVLLLEWCVYGFRCHEQSKRFTLWILWFLFAAPWLFAVLYFLYEPAFLLKGYRTRFFTVGERLLTESRIVMDYLGMIVLPDIRNMGLYHDDITISRSLLSPVSTLFSLLSIFALLLSAVFMRKRYPLYALGILWFFGGHIPESTIYPLELMFVHRNYLPCVGILLALVEVFICFHKHYARLAVMTLVAIFLMLSLNTRSLAYQWSDDYRLLLMEVLNHPRSVRANFRAGQVYKTYALYSTDERQRQEYQQRAFEYFNKIEELDKRDIRGKMGILETYLRLEQVPPESYIRDMKIALRRSWIEGGSLHIMESIKNCMVSGSCTLSEEDYYGILQALLNNPLVGGEIRRRLYVFQAEYLADGLGNIDAAITTLLEAIIGHPTYDDLKLLALYYEKGGYYEDAERTVSYLQEQDKFGRFAGFIKEFRARTRQHTVQ